MTVKIETLFTAAGATARRRCLVAIPGGEADDAESRLIYAARSQLVLANVDETGRSRVERTICVQPQEAIIQLTRVENDANNDWIAVLTGKGRLKVVDLRDGETRAEVFVDGAKPSSSSVAAEVAAIRTSASGKMILVTASETPALTVHVVVAGQNCAAQTTVQPLDDRQLPTAVALAQVADDGDSSFLNRLDARADQLLLALGQCRGDLELWTVRIEGENNVVTLARALVLKAAHGSDSVAALQFNRHLLCEREEGGARFRLASTGHDALVRVWSLDERGPRENGQDGEFEVAPKLVKIGGAKEERLLEVRLETVLAGHSDWVNGVDWHPNHSDILLSVSADKCAFVWRAPPSHSSSGDASVVNPLWSQVTCLGLTGGQRVGFEAAVWLSGKSICALSYYGALHAWGQSLEDDWTPLPLSLDGHVDAVTDACWEPSRGKYLVTCSQDQTTRAWARKSGGGGKHVEREDWREIGRPQVHGYGLNAVALLPQGVLASGADEKVLRILETPLPFAQRLAEMEARELEDVWPGAEKSLTPLAATLPALGLTNVVVKGAIDEDERFGASELDMAGLSLETSTSGRLRAGTLWPELQRLYGHAFELTAVAASPDGRWVASASRASQPSHATIMVWSTGDWKLAARLDAHQLSVVQLDWSGDSRRLLAASRDRTVSVSELVEDEWRVRWRSPTTGHHTRIVWSARWIVADEEARFVSASREGKVIVWRIEGTDDEQLKVASVASTTLKGTVTAVAGSAGVIVAGLETGRLVLLQVANDRLEIIQELDESAAHGSTVKAIRFHPANDGRFVTVGEDGCLKIHALCKTDC